MFGYAPQELVGRQIEVLVPASARHAHSDMRSDFFARPSKRAMGVGRDLKAVRRDGSEFPVEVGLTPIETDDGLLVLATVLDITARRDAEDALSKRALELERANERLARFAYVASHDLQEPLRKIVSFSQLLQEALAAADQAEIDYANAVMRNSALRARELVDDLLAFSRSVNDSYRFEEVCVAHEISVALDDLSETIKDARAEVVVEASPTLAVIADRTQFLRLIENLVSNALKYRKTGQPAHVCVHAERVGDGIRLCVSDNGIGVEPKYHKAIFEPFRRLHPRAQYPGAGIGLAICKSIADRHGWRLSIDSQLGEGASFVVWMPFAPVATGQPADGFSFGPRGAH